MRVYIKMGYQFVFRSSSW